MDPNRWHSLKELSELTGLSVKQLRRAIERGELQVHQLAENGRLYVTGDDWEAYRNQCAGRRRHGAAAAVEAPARQHARRPRRDLSAFRP